MEVVGDWPTARYTVICILLPEEVTLLAFSEWLAPCSMMTICSIRLVAQKTCQFVFCFILGPMCILSYCRERHWIRSKHIQKRRSSKRCATSEVYSRCHGRSELNDACMQLSFPMRGQLPCSERTSPNPYEAWSTKKVPARAMISVGRFCWNLEDIVVKSRHSDVVTVVFPKRLRPGSAKRYLCLATVVVGIFLEKTIPNRS